MREIVNRSLLVVKPNLAFYEWAKEVDEDAFDLRFEDVREDSTSYLVRDSEELDESERTIRTHYEEIFEAELFSWCTDEKKWPENITYSKFIEWFDVEYHSIVMDLIDEEIEIEDE